MATEWVPLGYYPVASSATDGTYMTCLVKTLVKAVTDEMDQMKGECCHRYAKEGKHSGATSVRGGEEKEKGGGSVPHLRQPQSH